MCALCLALPRVFVRYLGGVRQLIGLAIYNSVLLDLHFPLIVYQKLVGITPKLRCAPWAVVPSPSHPQAATHRLPHTGCHTPAEGRRAMRRAACVSWPSAVQWPALRAPARFSAGVIPVAPRRVPMCVNGGWRFCDPLH
jgi:hypothetical protein